MTQPSRSPLPQTLPPDFWDEPPGSPPPPPAAGLPSAWKESTNHLALPPAAQWQPQKLQFWYDGIIDLMVSEPGIKLRQIALRLGKSPVTIGLIVRSDMFKLRYEERRATLSEAIDARISSKLAKVAEKGLDITLEILESKGDKLAIGVVKELTLGALDRLGYSPQAAASPSVVVNNHSAAQAVVSPVSADVLAQARAAMAEVESVRRRVELPCVESSAPRLLEGDVLGPLEGRGDLDAL